jgi:hypothetical protein
MYLQKVKSKTNKKINLIFVGILEVTDEKSRDRSWIRSRIRKKVYGSKDPDPYQNVTDPEYCLAGRRDESWNCLLNNIRAEARPRNIYTETKASESLGINESMQGMV